MAVVVTQPLQHEPDRGVGVGSTACAPTQLVSLGSQGAPIHAVAHQGRALDRRERDVKVDSRNKQGALRRQGQSGERDDGD
jgi:hypothetical protein